MAQKPHGQDARATKTAVIINPRSAHGRTARRWPNIEARLRGLCPELTTFETRAPGHATELTRLALRQGYERVISVGGDGTHYEVINGFFDQGAAVNPDAIFAVLPFGTGSDLAKSLEVPKGDHAVALACSNRVMLADVGCIEHLSPTGVISTAYFLNTCHIGIGGEVALHVNGNSKAFGGFLTFLWGTLRALMTYRDKPMRLDIDGHPVEGVIKEVIVAKGQYDGGGMHVAPHARLNNGLFEVYVVGNIPALKAMRCLPLLYKGELHTRPDLVRCFRAHRVGIESPATIHVSPHGELSGTLPVKLEVIPRALRVVCGGAAETK